jgi:hypothetical protein
MTVRSTVDLLGAEIGVDEHDVGAVLAHEGLDVAGARVLPDDGHSLVTVEQCDKRAAHELVRLDDSDPHGRLLGHCRSLGLVTNTSSGISTLPWAHDLRNADAGGAPIGPVARAARLNPAANHRGFLRPVFGWIHRPNRPAGRPR